MWALYRGRALVGGEDGFGTFRLPLYECARGHLTGWRPEDDFLKDLALEVADVDYGGLNDGTVAPKRALFRGVRCGHCGSRMRLRTGGDRLRGEVHLSVRTSRDPISVEVDVPAAACAACSARPDIAAPALVGTFADFQTWFFQLLADAMPLSDVVETSPRQPR